MNELDNLEHAAQTSILELMSLAALAAFNINSGEWYMFGDSIRSESQRVADLLKAIENRRWEAFKQLKAAA